MTYVNPRTGWDITQADFRRKRNVSIPRVFVVTALTIAIATAGFFDPHRVVVGVDAQVGSGARVDATHCGQEVLRRHCPAHSETVCEVNIVGVEPAGCFSVGFRWLGVRELTRGPGGF